MNSEQFYRAKSATLKLEVDKLRKSVEKHKSDLKQKDKNLRESSNKTKGLKARLDETKAALATEREQIRALKRERDPPYEKLQEMLEETRFESKRFRTALAAAFKVVPQLQTKTTITQLLALTDRQLAAHGGPPVKPDCAQAGPHKRSRVKEEPPGEDEFEESGALGSLTTPTKRAAESSDSECDRPMAKARRTGRVSPRKIVLDE
jgi:hypothetical protein